MEAAVQPEIDALESLEERILRTVELLEGLRAERSSLEAALATAHTQGAEARTETARLAREVEDLRAERKQVRTRIEKLLQQLDHLTKG